jgi:hypothetical protein
LTSAGDARVELKMSNPRRRLKKSAAGEENQNGRRYLHGQPKCLPLHPLRHVIGVWHVYLVPKNHG